MKKIDWHKLSEAYNEAAEHLSLVASEEKEDLEQKAAYLEVERRLRKSMERMIRDQILKKSGE